MNLQVLVGKKIDKLDANFAKILIVIFLLRFAFLFFNSLGVVGDESYYWDWSRHLDWCYYSKPPMVAWLIAISTAFFGDNIVALRLPAVITGTVFLYYFYALAKLCYGRRTALFAFLLILSTPNNVLSNLIMTIDPPEYCFWMMAIYYLYSALFVGKANDWFKAGITTALAIITKLVALLLPLSLLVFILLERNRYHYLKCSFWQFLTPCLIVMVPIIIWNYQHHWIMFIHSQHHFSYPVATTSSGFVNAKDLFIKQLFLVSPIIFVLLLIMALKQLINFKYLRPDEQFLVLNGHVLLFAVLALGFIQKVQGNWPMPFYFSSIILCSKIFLQRCRKLSFFAVFLGLIFVTLTYFLPILLHSFGLQNSEWDPIKRFQYWRVLSEQIEKYRESAIPNKNHSFVLTLGHRDMASELAFYLPDHPKVFRYEPLGEVASQYELWPGPQEFMGLDALIVCDNSQPLPKEVSQIFAETRFVANVNLPENAKNNYSLYYGVKLLAWPFQLRYSKNFLEN